MFTAKEIIAGSRFKKELKKVVAAPKHQKDVQVILNSLTELLRRGRDLPEKYRDHGLHRLEGHRECHIKPDLLLIYKPEKEVIRFARIGSHSDIYSKNYQKLGG